MLNSDIKKRLTDLRSLFSTYDIDGYVVPTSDEYQNSYLPYYAKRLRYITGFSGSNGIAIILKSKILFFTDGRYQEQASLELNDQEFEIHSISHFKDFIPQGIILGLDYMLFTEKQIRDFDKDKIKFIDENLIDKIWENKPQKPNTEPFLYPLEYSGLDYLTKVENIRNSIKDKADHILITSPESICWLLNIRAYDLDFCPLILCYLLISKDKMFLFTNTNRKFDVIKQNINGIEILDESEIKSFLKLIDERVMVDSNCASIAIVSMIQNKVISEDPCIMMKACKEDVEIDGFRNSHIKDAIALCEVLALLESQEYSNDLSEYDVSLMLTEARKKQPNYIMDSFPPIVGYKSNGAIIHYGPKNESSKIIEGEGLLLIDSGGHYFGGSTDVTRTIKIGSGVPSDEQKIRYTQVLKGHIALSTLKIKKGTTGAEINILAYMYLWQDGMDFAHSPGHGVGNALSVHEGPQGISKMSNIPLRKNMVLSNEPGFYKTGEYGIRIENLIYVDDAKEEGFLEFKTLTLVPYCKSLIDMNMLSKEDIKYLKSYEAIIMEKIYPHLTTRAKIWIDKNSIN